MTHHPPPIPRQLWIKERCLAVESQFSRRIGRTAYVTRIVPLLAILILGYWNGRLATPLLPAWMATPIMIVAFYLSLLVFSHRFHDLGKSGANLLQIMLPVFVWLWVGGNLMAKLPPRIWITTAVILGIWPVVVLLRLAILPGLPSSNSDATQ